MKSVLAVLGKYITGDQIYLGVEGTCFFEKMAFEPRFEAEVGASQWGKVWRGTEDKHSWQKKLYVVREKKSICEELKEDQCS